LEPSQKWLGSPAFRIQFSFLACFCLLQLLFDRETWSFRPVRLGRNLSLCT
jgi:hypothetical protein